MKYLRVVALFVDDHYCFVLFNLMFVYLFDVCLNPPFSCLQINVYSPRHVVPLTHDEILTLLDTFDYDHDGSLDIKVKKNKSTAQHARTLPPTFITFHESVCLLVLTQYSGSCCALSVLR